MTDQMIRTLIDETLNNLPAVTIPGIYWGACDLSYHPDFGRKYNRGIAVIIPFYKRMTLEDYNESEFALLEMTTYRYRLEVGNALSAAFTKAGIEVEIPPVPKNHDVVYRVPLSVKDIAVHAGLGWIGKNDLLITPDYGPRVSMVGIVLNAEELSVGVPVTKSGCGDCAKCVSACPFHNIMGENWEMGRPREERVNYVRCSESRAKAKAKLGRKLACGKCICACPVGAAER